MSRPRFRRLEVDDPCYACDCCAKWTDVLQLLRDHIANHVAGEVRVAKCSPDCLVCGSADVDGGAGWQQ